MQLNKQETLAKLYALRGGLSIMSEIYDKVKIPINDMKCIESRIKFLKNQREKIRNETEERKNNFIYSIENEPKILKN